MTVRVKFSPGVFVWGHVFQRGDLPLFIRDSAGNAVSPAVVKFTMFRYPKGTTERNAVQVGAADRTPVNPDVGEYYVSAVAGEGGQPGDWYVSWTYQESVDSEKSSVIFPFKVYGSSEFKTSSSCGCNKACSCTAKW